MLKPGPAGRSVSRAAECEFMPLPWNVALYPRRSSRVERLPSANPQPPVSAAGLGPVCLPCPEPRSAPGGRKKSFPTVCTESVHVRGGTRSVPAASHPLLPWEVAPTKPCVLPACCASFERNLWREAVGAPLHHGQPAGGPGPGAQPCWGHV